MYTYMYIYTHSHLRRDQSVSFVPQIYIQISIHTFTRQARTKYVLYVSNIHTYVYVCVCVRMYVCMYVHIHIHIRTHLRWDQIMSLLSQYPQKARQMFTCSHAPILGEKFLIFFWVCVCSNVWYMPPCTCCMYVLRIQCLSVFDKKIAWKKTTGCMNLHRYSHS